MEGLVSGVLDRDDESDRIAESTRARSSRDGGVPLRSAGGVTAVSALVVRLRPWVGVNARGVRSGGEEK